MKHIRILNNHNNRLHKRALNLVHNYFSLSFLELLEKNRSVTIHHRKLQMLAYEIFKMKNKMTPKIFTDNFPPKESNYNLRNCTTLHGRNLFLIWGQKYGTFLPTHKKILCLIHYWKKEICEWTPKICPWHLCKTYIQNIGFLLAINNYVFPLQNAIYVIHIKESAEAVIDGKLTETNFC